MVTNVVDWLLKNKEWLFSGVGVTALLGLLAFARYVPKLRKPSPTPEPTQVSRAPDHEQPDLLLTVVSRIARVSPVTPEEMQASIESAPPLQREAVASRYTNLRIEWDTELTSARNKGAAVDLQLRAFDPAKSRRSFSVMCKVNLEDYRELAVLPERARVRVNGLVEHVTTHWVSLNDARLTFLPAPPDA